MQAVDESVIAAAGNSKQRGWMLATDFGECRQQKVEPFFLIEPREKQNDLAICRNRKSLVKSVRRGQHVEFRRINAEWNHCRFGIHAYRCGFAPFLFAGVMDSGGVLQNAPLDE